MTGYLVNDSIPLRSYEVQAEARVEKADDDMFAHMVLELAAEVRRLTGTLPEEEGKIVWCKDCTGWVAETEDPAAHVVIHSDPEWRP